MPTDNNTETTQTYLWRFLTPCCNDDRTLSRVPVIYDCCVHWSTLERSSWHSLSILRSNKKSKIKLENIKKQQKLLFLQQKKTTKIEKKQKQYILDNGPVRNASSSSFSRSACVFSLGSTALWKWRFCCGFFGNVRTRKATSKKKKKKKKKSVFKKRIEMKRIINLKIANAICTRKRKIELIIKWKVEEYIMKTKKKKKNEKNQNKKPKIFFFNKFSHLDIFLLFIYLFIYRNDLCVLYFNGMKWKSSKLCFFSEKKLVCAFTKLVEHHHHSCCWNRRHCCCNQYCCYIRHRPKNCPNHNLLRKWFFKILKKRC